jgi:hypothetical protein
MYALRLSRRPKPFNRSDWIFEILSGGVRFWGGRSYVVMECRASYRCRISGPEDVGEAPRCWSPFLSYSKVALRQAIRYKKMPFAFLMTEYMKRLEAGDPRAIAVRNSIIRLWRMVAPYLIAHRSKEWWQAGYR